MMAKRRHGSSSRQRGRSRSAGFTIVELMVTVAVLAVLLALAVPNFNDASLSARLSSFANSLVASAQVARSEAIKRNSTIRLCASSDGATCDGADWEEGWIVLTQDDAVLQVQQALPDEFRVIEAGGTDELSFLGTVVGTTPAILTVCRSTPVGSEERVVTISGTGSAYVSMTTAGSCS